MVRQESVQILPAMMTMIIWHISECHHSERPAAMGATIGNNGATKKHLADWKSMNLTEVGDAGLSSCGSVYLRRFQMVLLWSRNIWALQHMYVNLDLRKVSTACGLKSTETTKSHMHSWYYISHYRHPGVHFFQSFFPQWSQNWPLWVRFIEGK